MEKVISKKPLHQEGIPSCFGNTSLTQNDFLEKDQVIQLGRAPNRIDLLTGISGVSWEEAWASHPLIRLDGIEIPLIGKQKLIRNKEATGRPQDLADVARSRKN